MATKRALARRIWNGFAELQSSSPSRRSHGLPGMIPCGDGKSVIISDQMSIDISLFTRLVHENDPALRVAFGSADIDKVARRAFGEALVDIDLDEEPEAACDQLLASIGEAFATELEPSQVEQTYVFGCWLIRDEFVDDVGFGPVRFERRERWLNRMHQEGRASTLIRRRVLNGWQGGKQRPLKNPYNRMREESFTEAIGPCPTVCSVSTLGLAEETGRQKATLSARLAMTAVALLWDRPAKALEGFGLLIDGAARNQNFLVLGKPGAWSSRRSSGRLIGATWIEQREWERLWADHAWLTKPIGDMFSSLLKPGLPASRPNINRSLIHALWWFHEACRAEAPLMAAAKYGTCLDILAGGRSEGAILQFVKARFRIAPDDPITPDGRTAREVVSTIYGAARSQTMHGSNDRYDHDWTGTRDLAEHLTRLCISAVLSWLEDNPDATSLSGARVRTEAGYDNT